MVEAKLLDIEAYLCWALTNRNNGVRALARKQAVIRSFYHYLLREDLVSRDITLKLILIHLGQKAPKALEPEQIADLVDILETGSGLSKGQLKYHTYTEKRDFAIFITFIGTGIRLTELYSLNLQNTLTSLIPINNAEVSPFVLHFEQLMQIAFFMSPDFTFQYA